MRMLASRLTLRAKRMSDAPRVRGETMMADRFGLVLAMVAFALGVLGVILGVIGILQAGAPVP